MRKITWIVPTLCIILAVLFSFGSIPLFTPALVNSYSSAIDDRWEFLDTTRWVQDEQAHDMLLWQAKHGSKMYSSLCVQYLIDAYYHPLSDWSYAHPETGEAVYRLAIPLFESQGDAQADLRFYSSLSVLTEGGFRNYNTYGADYGDIHLQFAAYQYLHIDKEAGKQTYLTFSDSTDDHYYCDRFLKFVTTAEKSAADDIAWAKAEALRAESLLLAEYEADKARAQEAQKAQTEARLNEDTDEDDWYFDSFSTYTAYSEQQIEMKCQALREIAEPSA